MTKEGDVMVVIRTASDDRICSPECDWYQEGPVRLCHLARADGDGPEELLEEVDAGTSIIQAKRCQTCLACFP